MTLRLHYAPDNASLCVRLALALAEVPFETALVDRTARSQLRPEYLALNPNGLIPVLETPEGPIFETAAILLWLSGRYPQAGLELDGPGTGWLVWMSNALHPALRMIFYPHSLPPAQGLHAAGMARAAALYDIAEARLPAAPLLDCYLCPMLRWSVLYPVGGPRWFDLDRWPRLASRARDFEDIPAIAEACNAEGLGPAPFTAPRPAAPPEGSAT